MKKEYSQPLEFNRGGNFKLEDQPVRKAINQKSANGWQRGAFAEKPKEREKEKEENWRTVKTEKPKEKEENWRTVKTEKPKEKEENWRVVINEKPKEKEKEENWRVVKNEKPKEKNDGQWERGANAGKKNKKK